MKSRFVGLDIKPEDWRQMVVLYSRKHLTYPKDILPALSGITNRLTGAGKYFGGIWEDQFVYDLLWLSTCGRTAANLRLPVPYSGPSFLWSSIIGDKTFINIPPTYERVFSIDINLTPKDHDPLGELEGYIRVTARSIEATFANTLLRPKLAKHALIHCEDDELCLWGTIRCEGIGFYLFREFQQRAL